MQHFINKQNNNLYGTGEQMEQCRHGWSVPLFSYNHIFPSDGCNATGKFHYKYTYVASKVQRMHVPAVVFHEKVVRQV